MPLKAAPLTLLLLVLIGSGLPQERPVRLDSSDWWSFVRRAELPPGEPHQPVQHRAPEETNFNIAGITLGSPWGFSEIRSKFGEGTEIERGEAASGRNQICYISPSGNTHLIFEFGEIEAVLYLFKDGPKWNGSELCSSSAAISANISTRSGLRLGMRTQEVKSILGIPSVATPQKLVYYFSFRKKTTRKVLAQLKKKYPNMSNMEIVKNFEYMDVEAYIEARFAFGKVNYLAISRSESY